MLRVLTIFSLFASLSLQVNLHAASGDPIAIQRWTGEELTIETLSGLRVLIQSETGDRLTDQDADITLLPGAICDHRLYRKSNEEHPIWQRASLKQVVNKDAAIARSIRLRPIDQTTVLSIEVDGLSILVIPPKWGDGESAYASEEAVDADVLILPSTNHEQLLSPSIQSLIATLKPQIVLLSGLDIDNDSFEDIAAEIYPDAEAQTLDQNTLAVRYQQDDQMTNPLVIRMDDQSWKMPKDLNKKFLAMEASSDYSQRVLTQLSTNRMNFKPSNGTHTPRWNAEHMMGRQLKFFSQIYHAIDPMIPVMDLNPKQMPKDYVAAHPNWDGAEEARQIKRVGEFCRRYAYLLDGIALNDKPPAVGWPTLGILLKQMDNHYREHTANVVKKFDLPDWPAEAPVVHATAPPISKPVLVPSEN